MRKSDVVCICPLVSRLLVKEGTVGLPPQKPNDETLPIHKHGVASRPESLGAPEPRAANTAGTTARVPTGWWFPALPDET